MVINVIVISMHTTCAVTAAIETITEETLSAGHTSTRHNLTRHRVKRFCHVEQILSQILTNRPYAAMASASIFASLLE